ncbi:unnamed protein product [Lactuca saligna]|uniref:Uncharacterized protein n=1 Tax=Lactuca saligna TaxID=75948 RepID=A0AA35ZMT5_LACSI|nr:unnamed protein product [Lactuca saligna]
MTILPLSVFVYVGCSENLDLHLAPITLVKLNPKDVVSFPKLITQGSNNQSPFCFHPPKPDDVATSGHQSYTHPYTMDPLIILLVTCFLVVSSNDRDPSYQLI